MMIRTNVEISNSLFTDLPRDNSNYIDTVTDNIHYFNAMFQFTYSVYDTHFIIFLTKNVTQGYPGTTGRMA